MEIPKVFEDKYWAAWGIALSLGALALAIYTDFFRDNRPQLQIEVLSSTPVIDVREELSELSITYAGKDIVSSGLTLRVILLRISNPGREGITPTDFDVGDLPGFKITTGEVVRIDQLKASNQYLGDNVVPILSQSNEIRFGPVIVDSGDFLQFKALVLHKVGASPEIAPIGKVAGVREILVVPIDNKLDEPGFLMQTYSGRPTVQVVRGLTYPFLTIITVFLVVFPIVTFVERYGRYARQRDANRFLLSRGANATAFHKFFLAKYVDIGAEILIACDKWLRRPEAVRALAGRYVRRGDDSRRYMRTYDNGIPRTMLLSGNTFFEMNGPDLFESGVLVLGENGKWVVADGVGEVLNELLIATGTPSYRSTISGRTNSE